MGATLEKRTNNFWMPNYQYKSSLFSFRKSHVTVVLGYHSDHKKYQKIPSTTAQPTNQPKQLGGGNVDSTGWSCVDLHDDATNTPNVLKDEGFFETNSCESSDEVCVWKW